MTYTSLHRLTNNQYLIKAAKLMDEPIVRQEIKNQLAQFTGEIQNKFGDRRIIDELDDLLTFSKKGSDAHRGNIQFIMELRGLKDKPSPKHIKPRAEDAEYAEVPPSEADV